jgi:hydrogenase expression/formation protein HypC
MCIGIPMRILESDGFTALCERRGGTRRFNIMLLADEAKAGGWVLTSAGNAVRLLDDEEAAQINEALDALAAAMNGEPLDGYFADLRPDATS